VRGSQHVPIMLKLTFPGVWLWILRATWRSFGVSQDGASLDGDGGCEKRKDGRVRRRIRPLKRLTTVGSLVLVCVLCHRLFGIARFQIIALPERGGEGMWAGRTLGVGRTCGTQTFTKDRYKRGKGAAKTPPPGGDLLYILRVREKGRHAGRL